MGLPAFVVFYIFELKLKSKVAYMFASCVLAILFLVITIRGANSIALTEMINGHYAYDKGSITPFGVFYELIDPLMVIAVFSIARLIYKKNK